MRKGDIQYLDAREGKNIALRSSSFRGDGVKARSWQVHTYLRTWKKKHESCNRRSKKLAEKKQGASSSPQNQLGDWGSRALGKGSYGSLIRSVASMVIFEA